MIDPDLIKRHQLCVSITILTVLFGLIAHSIRDRADPSTPMGFIATYLADTLWAVLFFYILATLRPRLRTLTLTGMTLLITLGIELSQLYTGEPLATLRDFAPTRFLLGSHFLWSDIACLLVGTALAAGLHLALPKPDDAPIE